MTRLYNTVSASNPDVERGANNSHSIPLESISSSHLRVGKRHLVAGCAFVTGLILLAFTLGRTSVSSSTSYNAHQCNGGSGILQDSVSPEGPVSSDFDAIFDYRGHRRAITSSQGVVAADHGRCSDIGVSILEKGGNAVDAAVACALCQGIYNPMASGVGGGHIMVIRRMDGESEAIDAREVAALASNETMFYGHPELSLTGGLAIAVPLELKGLHLAHTRHGILPWKDLVLPSSIIADQGFPAHPYLISALQYANFTHHTELRDIFMIKDNKIKSMYRPPKINETCCKRPQLAQFLRDVAEEGPDVLYTGKYADGFIQDIQNAGGILTKEDLEIAEASVKDTLKFHVMGVDMMTAPPPSSGAALATALMILAGYELPLAGAGSLGVHREIEAMKHAFALRMSLGDPGNPHKKGAKSFLPDLDKIIHDMLSQKFADSLRHVIRDDSILNTTEYGGKYNIITSGVHPEDHGTTHVSIVDSNRMAVGLTSTINTGFGSKVVSASTGILLNNQMDDFSTPGQPNVYGIPPSPSNFIRPGKKPFSSMSPVVVDMGGKFRMVIGASGGPRIISAVLQTLLKVLAYGEDGFSAVAGPRMHHQLVPDVLYAENWSAGGAKFAYDNDTLIELEERGHTIGRSAWGAVVQAVFSSEDASVGISENDGGGGDGGSNSAKHALLHAISDPRKDGAPAGY